jgi:hypothetical protein
VRIGGSARVGDSARVGGSQIITLDVPAVIEPILTEAYFAAGFITIKDKP